MSMRRTIVTFGCRLNAYETEVMRGHAAAAGLRDAVIVNTCAVTAEAERQARQAIRKARREQPERPHHRHRLRRADRPAGFAAMPEVDQVLGNAEKLQARDLPALAAGDVARIDVDDIMAVRETAAHLVDRLRRPGPRLRAGAARLRPPLHLLHHPLGRGNTRSVPLGAVVDAGARAGRRRASARWC